MNLITLEDTRLSAAKKMCSGNVGVLSVLLAITSTGAHIDPDAAMGSMNGILLLDALKIYGSRIWQLYNDVCDSDLTHMLACLRAVQMGLISADVLNHAIENRGEGIEAEKVLQAVQELLPRFGRKPGEEVEPPEISNNASQVPNWAG